MAEAPDRQYLHGHDATIVASHAARTAEECAAFLLPKLEPGMRLLDVGCGPGSITLGLARAVAPGEVLGIDPVAEVVAQARERAEREGVSNVRFEAGTVEDAPFDPASFDVAYAHQVLQHVERPVDTLRAMRRHVRPGGWIAARDMDWGASAFWPRDPDLERFVPVYCETARRSGGDGRAGRRLRGWFHEAGLPDAEISAVSWVWADAEATRAWGLLWAERITRTRVAEKAVEYGVASQSELDAIGAAFLRWGEHPDAFLCLAQIAALASNA